mmetsp:Transcript_38856/g.60707  ORF Transcript_38856/g.60707 Transcript_38856/m.60707 type:complete len:100 (+) Transcript_38856:156-455(+)
MNNKMVAMYAQNSDHSMKKEIMMMLGILKRREDGQQHPNLECFSQQTCTQRAISMLLQKIYTAVKSGSSNLVKHHLWGWKTVVNQKSKHTTMKLFHHLT